MGMDVYGLNPTSEAPPRPEHNDFDSEDWKAYFDGQSLSGQYFRNNVWWWRPLWDYVADLCNEVISEKDHNAGHYNDGHHISKDQCDYIANRLSNELLNGGVKKYSKEYKEEQDNLPMVECHCCEGTGKGAHYSEGKDTCHVCKGSGEVEHSGHHYPFSIDNVREFLDFVKNCGGFEIC
jgi:hypothetical protein